MNFLQRSNTVLKVCEVRDRQTDRQMSRNRSISADHRAYSICVERAAGHLGLGLT